MATKTDNIDMENLILEILKQDSPFSEEMRTKISDVIDSSSKDLKSSISKMKVSKDSVDISSIMGVNESDKNKSAESYKKTQAKIMEQLKQIALASNYKDIKRGVNITDILGSDKLQNERISKQFTAIQNKLISTLKTSIPNKINIKDLIGKETMTGIKSKIDAISVVDKKIKTKEEIVTDTDKKEESLSKVGMADLIKAVNISTPKPADTKDSNVATDFGGKEPGRESFFEKVEPQEVNLVDISKDTLNKISKALGGKDVGDIKLKKLDEGKTGGLLTSILAGLFGGTLPAFLLAAGPIAAIIGGLLWMGLDAVKGWMKADEWGTSKISGLLGGLLGGTGEAGWKNAFKQLGKWALTGVGIGFVTGGPIGAIIGGMIGGVIGAILGFIGGEKIAKALDLVALWATEAYTIAVESLTVAFEWITEKFTAIKEWFGTFFSGDAETKWVMIKDAITSVFTWIGELGFKIVSWVDESLEKVFGEKWNNFKESIGKVFTWIGDLGSKILIWADESLEKIFGEKWTVLKDSILRVFTKIGEFGTTLWTGLEAFFTGSWEDAKKTLEEGFGYIFNFVKKIGSILKEQVEKISHALGLDIKTVETDIKVTTSGGKTSSDIMAEYMKEGGLTDEQLFKEFRLLYEKLGKGEKSSELAEEMVAKLKAEKEIQIVSEKKEDFIWRAGQSPISISTKDNLIGFKDIIKVENKNTDEQLYILNKSINDINVKFDSLLTFQNNNKIIPQRNTEPLPPISPTIETYRGTADDAFYHKIKVWELLHGVT